MYFFNRKDHLKELFCFVFYWIEAIVICWWFCILFVFLSFLVTLQLVAVGKIGTIYCVVNYGLIYFQISIENDYLGPRRIESLQKEDADWQRKAHMAVLSIQDLTVKYFEITAKTQKGSYFWLSYSPNKRSLKMYLMFTMSCIVLFLISPPCVKCSCHFHLFFLRVSLNISPISLFGTSSEASRMETLDKKFHNHLLNMIVLVPLYNCKELREHRVPDGFCLLYWL